MGDERPPCSYCGSEVRLTSDLRRSRPGMRLNSAGTLRRVCTNPVLRNPQAAEVPR